MLSSLIAQLLRTAQEDNPAEVKVSPDVGDREATGRAVSGDIGTESSVGSGAGVGVFFVWSSKARSESMLPGEYFVSLFATGLGGYVPGWPMSGGMA